MTENIFEIVSAADALRTPYSEDHGALLTDFSCAYPSVDHRLILLVLERAGVPLVPRLFLLGIYRDSIIFVEHAGAPRGQVAMMRGARQGCPASGHLFTMAFDPVYRWLMTVVLPPEPHRPWSLQRCACAYADDFALATASLRESHPTVAKAFLTMDAVTGMFLNHKKCHCIQCGNLDIPQLSEWVVSFTIYALSVLSFIGSVAEPDTATIKAEILALQRLSAGPFHSLLSALLRRGSACGLKVDTDGIYSRARLPGTVWPPSLVGCPVAWIAFAPVMITKAPLRLPPEIGM